MQSDFESVEKVPFSSVRMSFCPEMLEIGLSRLRRCPTSLQDLSGGVSRFSRHPDTGNCRPHFFDSTRSNKIQTPNRIEKNVFFDPIHDRDHIHLIWIEKVRTVISCNWAPPEAGNTP